MRITLDTEYCVKCDTQILGVAGEKNARTMIFNGLEVDGASRYRVRFALPDKTSHTGTISGGAYTIPAEVARLTGEVGVQITAMSESGDLIRKSNILTMKVVDAIDYDPPDPGGGDGAAVAIGAPTSLAEGTAFAFTGNFRFFAD